MTSSIWDRSERPFPGKSPPNPPPRSLLLKLWRSSSQSQWKEKRTPLRVLRTARRRLRSKSVLQYSRKAKRPRVLTRSRRSHLMLQLLRRSFLVNPAELKWRLGSELFLKQNAIVHRNSTISESEMPVLGMRLEKNIFTLLWGQIRTLESSSGLYTKFWIQFCK